MNLASILLLLQMAVTLLLGIQNNPGATIEQKNKAFAFANEAVSTALVYVKQNANVAASGTAAVTLPAPTSTMASGPSDSLPPAIAIDPETLVGILCYYDVTYTNKNNGVSVQSDVQEEARGSGIIINSQGNILTNRHVIEMAEETTSIAGSNGDAIPVSVDYKLNHCEVGQVPKSEHLPTVDQIQQFNPFVQVPVLGYVAQPVFVSPAAGSAAEIQRADYAILKITGLTKDGPTFGVTSVPSVFPYAKMLPVRQYHVVGDQVVTYGFPGDVTAGQGNFFETLTMTGSTGNITGIDLGDNYYADLPITIYTNMEISHGRSGSPIFWRGYVIGLVTFFIGDNRLDSGSVASDSILKGLQSAGYLPAS